jgi:hypothetical protein
LAKLERNLSSRAIQPFNRAVEQHFSKIFQKFARSTEPFASLPGRKQQLNGIVWMAVGSISEPKGIERLPPQCF